MATCFDSVTKLFDSQAVSITFADAESLHDAPVCGVGQTFWEAQSEEDRKMLMVITRMSSRGSWASGLVRDLCILAKIEDLPFLYGASAPNLRWKLPIGIEDGEDEVYAHAHGYLFYAEELKKAVSAIDHLFDWSMKNADILAHADRLGYYATEAEIREAIASPVVSQNPSRDRDVPYSEDGDGPWCLYSWLHSVRVVLNTALRCNKCVLHTCDVPL
jgi:hypothetical protein